MTVKQVMDEILLDRAFYESSGGGVTLSGGEPALQCDFAYELLTGCKSEGLHTAIETCGEYPWASLEGLLPVTDLIMMDLKHMTPYKHQKATGRPNDRILANARTLALTEKPIVFRTPIVPTVNDTDEEVGHIASFIRELIELRTKNGKPHGTTISYELLPFHKLASDKYSSLGIEYNISSINPPTRERISELVEVARRNGVEARSR